MADYSDKLKKEVREAIAGCKVYLQAPERQWPIGEIAAATAPATEILPEDAINLICSRWSDVNFAYAPIGTMQGRCQLCQSLIAISSKSQEIIRTHTGWISIICLNCLPAYNRIFKEQHPDA